MKLINREWNAYLNKYKHTWLADDESQLTSDFDTEGAAGSTVLVISTNETFMKNCEGKWQKCGTTEVLAENWLFKDQYLTTDGNATLPAPVVGTSYTVFVDGVEKVTTVCLDENEWFMWDDGAVTYRYDEGWCFAFDPPSNALTESGTVSIRIND